MNQTTLASELYFPHQVSIEGIPVHAFQGIECLFGRICHEIETPQQSIIYYLNVHVANTAYREPTLKDILQRGDIVYCDGAGIVKASKILGSPLPIRMTAADWILDLIAYMTNHGRTLFFLGGEPGIPERALQVISDKIENHTILGMHHGYILNDKALEAQVIHQINQAKPDVLIVGFGTPLQEQWIDAHRHELDVPVIYAIGAVLDYIAGKVSRCPAWMGANGLEWLYRFYTEPRRLFGRYIVGNPWFLSRILLTKFLGRKTLQKQ